MVKISLKFVVNLSVLKSTHLVKRIPTLAKKTLVHDIAMWWLNFRHTFEESIIQPIWNIFYWNWTIDKLRFYSEGKYFKQSYHDTGCVSSDNLYYKQTTRPKHFSLTPIPFVISLSSLVQWACVIFCATLHYCFWCCCVSHFLLL